MKSFDTGVHTQPVNLIEKCGYLVYGEAKPSDIVGRFEAWYWTDLPGNPPKRIAGASKLLNLTYGTAGEAIAMALQFGVIAAGELPSQGGAA